MRNVERNGQASLDWAARGVCLRRGVGPVRCAPLPGLPGGDDLRDCRDEEQLAEACFHDGDGLTRVGGGTRSPYPVVVRVMKLTSNTWAVSPEPSEPNCGVACRMPIARYTKAKTCRRSDNCQPRRGPIPGRRCGASRGHGPPGPGASRYSSPLTTNAPQTTATSRERRRPPMPGRPLR